MGQLMKDSEMNKSIKELTVYETPDGKRHDTVHEAKRQMLTQEFAALWLEHVAGIYPEDVCSAEVLTLLLNDWHDVERIVRQLKALT